MIDPTPWIALIGRLLELVAAATGRDYEELRAELRARPHLDEPGGTEEILETIQDTLPGEDL